ncbi:MAG: hypothetical protein AABX16_00810 [Nanoarchaeota archaeon]|mgnify:CR=1 FL=1
MANSEKFKVEDFLIPLKSFLDYSKRVSVNYNTDLLTELPKPVQRRVLGLAVYNAFYTVAAAMATVAGTAYAIKGLEQLMQ